MIGGVSADFGIGDVTVHGRDNVCTFAKICPLCRRSRRPQKTVIAGEPSSSRGDQREAGAFDQTTGSPSLPLAKDFADFKFEGMPINDRVARDSLHSFVRCGIAPRAAKDATRGTRPSPSGYSSVRKFRSSAMFERL